MTKLIATICYYLQLHRIAYFLNRERKRIITFHNVLTDDVYVDNLANGVSNSLSQFTAIIDEIAKRFDFSLDLDDAKTVTLTFDDGYRNQAEVAAPYLLSKGIPAYLFVVGSKMGGVIVDKLLHWCSCVPNGSYNIVWQGTQNKIEMTDDNRLGMWTNFLWPAFMNDAASKGYDLLMALDAAFPMQQVIESLPHKYVEQRLSLATEEQLDALAKHGWQIGWHTLSHYPLSKLSREEKVKELTKESRMASDVLSFPYGGPQEVDRECLEIAQQLGYKTAVSNVNVENDLTGVWFRSRMALSSDPILLHFELSGLKHLMKYRKLLPKI